MRSHATATVVMHLVASINIIWRLYYTILYNTIHGMVWYGIWYVMLWYGMVHSI